MGKETISSHVDLYRHRYAFERIKKAALYGSNQIGSIFAALWVPQEFDAIKERLTASLKILKGALQDLKTSQIAFQTNLPPLPAELLAALTVLDQKLVAHERAAHQWFLSNRRVLRAEDVQAGDWIYFNQSIVVGFQFQAALDPTSAEMTQLGLDWRFPSVEYRLDGEAHIEKYISPPFFKFGQWADDHDPVNRPEVLELRSELLRAFLPHVPELAFFASYASSCTLTLDGGREWQASLPAFNTNAKPASRQ